MKLYNTYSNLKEEFKPIDASCVKMYVCGPTVYDEIHVGNARSIIVFDLLFRILKEEYGQVIYVRNITDIDDKIITRAVAENISSSQVASKCERWFVENYRKLNVLEPTYQPRATETIKEIIESIGELIENDYAYIKDDHVLFKVDMLDSYGALSKQSNVMNSAAVSRIVTSEYKDNERDFVLWKPSKLNEPYWNSPWGKGRPGWHIECTAMSAKFLGHRFDIHGGGQDLLFPHHENEQAQNVGLYGEHAGPRYWVHNAMVLFDNQKMSKSLGNTVRLSQAFAEHDPMIIRFFIITTHYQHALIWKDENLKQAASRYKRWMYHLNGLANKEEIIPKIFEILKDNMNVPAAFALFEEMLSNAIAADDKDMLVQLANTLNWLGCIKKSMSNEVCNENLLKMLEEKLKERDRARMAKDYALADQIRLEIEKHGYEIVDSASGSKLKNIK